MKGKDEPDSVQIYFIIISVEEMIFEQMVRRYCLHFKYYPVFEIPFQANGNYSFSEVRCNERMDIQQKLSCFNFIDDKRQAPFKHIGEEY